MNSRVKLSEKAHAYLQEKRFAVLATLNEDGTPQLTTMWYLLEDDGTILMNTKVGRAKERNMRRDPRISVCVEDGYIYVTLSGKVEMIDDPEIPRLPNAIFFDYRHVIMAKRKRSGKWRTNSPKNSA